MRHLQSSLVCVTTIYYKKPVISLFSMAKRRNSGPLTPPRTPARRRIAQASGAVIGYTLGNIPGAVAGYYAGSRLARRGGSKKSVTFDGTTIQRDDKVSYVKKRMPRRKKKAWKKFVKKVVAVEIGDRGLQIAKFNQNGFSSVTVPALGQTFKAFHLYGAGSTAGEPGVRDIWQIAKDVEAAGTNWIKVAGGYINPTIPNDSMKVPIRMQSAILDLYMKNTGTVTLVLDIYHLWYRGKTNAPSFFDGYNWVQAKEVKRQDGDTAGATDNTQLDLTIRGATLFDEPQVLSFIGCTIKSVRQIQLTPGGVHTMQTRDPKNYNIDLFKYLPQDGVSYTPYVDPKLTESYVVVAKNLDGSDSGSLLLYADRTYRYTIEGVKTVKTGVKTFSS